MKVGIQKLHFTTKFVSKLINYEPKRLFHGVGYHAHKLIKHSAASKLNYKASIFKQNKTNYSGSHFEDHMDNYETLLSDTDSLVDSDFSSILDGQRVAVIQPVFTGMKQPSLTTPKLQLQESVSLIDSIPNWTVEDKLVVYAKSKKELFKREEFDNDLLSMTDGYITAIFVSVPRLSGMDISHIYKITGLEHIYDRYSLVLEIFRSRATTRQAKLQVALAELPHRKRMAQYSLDKHFDTETLSKRGESHFELMMRKFGDKEKRIKRVIKKLEKSRKMTRDSRKRSFLPIVAVVGYTNAGKTSLIKALTSSEKFQPEDTLFATLDVAATSAHLPNGTRYILIDTIGFLSDLPHELIHAFSVTLEDMLQADLILHVRDISHPESRKQLRDVLKTLTNLNTSDRLLDNIIEVRNKVDIIPQQYEPNNIKVVHPKKLLATASSKGKRACIPQSICPVSSHTGAGIHQLLEEIEDHLMKATDRKMVELEFPTGGQHLNWLREHLGQVSDVEGHRDYFMRVNLPITGPQLNMFLSTYPDAKIVSSHSNFS